MKITNFTTFDSYLGKLTQFAWVSFVVVSLHFFNTNCVLLNFFSEEIPKLKTIKSKKEWNAKKESKVEQNDSENYSSFDTDDPFSSHNWNKEYLAIHTASSFFCYGEVPLFAFDYLIKTQLPKIYLFYCSFLE